MSKPRTKLPKDVTPFWTDRGYDETFVPTKPDPNEDPRGETAYQRAFYEAARSKPPRLPNPSHYPNSQSAREYMRRSGSETSNHSRRDGRSAEDREARTARQQRTPDLTAEDIKKSTSTSPVISYNGSSRITLAPIRADATRRIPSIVELSTPSESMAPGQRTPMALTPQGPANTLRPWL